MQTALVTGARRGMGLEFTRQLLSRGDTVLATVRDPDSAPQLRALGEAHPGRLQILCLDVSDHSSIRKLGPAVKRLVPQLDLLVNNAGINSKAVKPHQSNTRFGSLEPEGILRMVAVNAIGPVLVTQALTESLQQSPGARVISVSSWLGSIAGKTRGGNYGYCASKTTLNMLTRAMAFDLLPLGIVSVVFNPGWVRTDMGGPRAKLGVDESVAGMIRVTGGLTEADAGRFLQWDGSDLPW